MVVADSSMASFGVPASSVLIWGTGVYRQSDICFAWAPLVPGMGVPGPEEWYYLTDVTASGPVFERGKMERAMGLIQWSKSGVVTPKTTFTADEAAASLMRYGEISVTYLAESKLWLLMGGGDDVDFWANYVRFSKTPWGPWYPADGLRIHADVDASVAHSGLYSTNGLQMLYRGAGNGEEIWFDGSFFGKEDFDHGQVHLFSAKIVVR